jgi:hypothetical protein
MSCERKLLLCLLIPLLRCIAADTPRPEVTRKTLDAPIEIQGYPCAKGYAFFYSDGRLNQCSVSRETAFGEVRVPSGSLINLRLDGKPQYAMLSHNANILSYRCRGGSWLGPGEGAMTAFYPSGKLKECFLAGDQDIQGVPCMGGSFFADVFGGGSGTFFYESGKLRSCKLSKDFGNLRRGEHIFQVR